MGKNVEIFSPNSKYPIVTEGLEQPLDNDILHQTENGLSGKTFRQNKIKTGQLFKCICLAGNQTGAHNLRRTIFQANDKKEPYASIAKFSTNPPGRIHDFGVFTYRRIAIIKAHRPQPGRRDDGGRAWVVESAAQTVRPAADE
ncbi:MAG: hypothetical protein ABIU20_06195 [Blastocatellia bacterium]